MKYEELKDRTLVDANIVYVEYYYRYVNHADRLITTGFGTKEALLRHTDTIRFDSTTIYLMRTRYHNLYELT